MKQIFFAMMLLAMTSGIAFAGGDQNQGTTGTGSTSTGSDAQGTASQPRTGR